MTNYEPTPSRRLRRSRTDRVLGGVCGGIALSLGVDSLLVRIAVLVLGLLSSGIAVLAYLIAWVLIPQAVEESEPRPRQPEQAPNPKQAWTAAGEDLRALARGLRDSARKTPDAKSPRAAGEKAVQPDGAPQRRSAVEVVDSAMTGLGKRLRDPELQARTRQVATGLSTAINASVDELGHRAKRGAAKENQGTQHPTQ